MKKLLFLLILSVSGQVSFASEVSTVVVEFQKEEPYNTERFDEYSAAYGKYLSLQGAQISAANANIKRYLKDKHILDKSVNGLSQSEYNYRLEKLKIELTYKLKATLVGDQVQKFDLLLKVSETAEVKKIKQMLFL